MTNFNLSQTIARIAVFNCEIAQLREAVTALAAAEPDHAARGPLLTLATVLNDLHHPISQAQAQYQASARHAA
jgi:hypothetical protein